MGCDHYFCGKSQSVIPPDSRSDRAGISGIFHLGDCVLQRVRASNEKLQFLLKCGLCLAAACLTRYDGWFLAVAMCAVALLVVWRQEGIRAVLLHAGLRKFILIAAAAPNSLADLQRCRLPQPARVRQWSILGEGNRATDRDSRCSTSPRRRQSSDGGKFLSEIRGTQHRAKQLASLVAGAGLIGNCHRACCLTVVCGRCFSFGFPCRFICFRSHTGHPHFYTSVVAILPLQRALWC